MAPADNVFWFLQGSPPINLQEYISRCKRTFNPIFPVEKLNLDTKGEETWTFYRKAKQGTCIYFVFQSVTVHLFGVQLMLVPGIWCSYCRRQQFCDNVVNDKLDISNYMFFVVKEFKYLVSLHLYNRLYVNSICLRKISESILLLVRP